MGAGGGRGDWGDGGIGWGREGEGGGGDREGEGATEGGASEKPAPGSKNHPGFQTPFRNPLRPGYQMLPGILRLPGASNNRFGNILQTERALPFRSRGGGGKHPHTHIAPTRGMPAAGGRVGL